MHGDIERGCRAIVVVVERHRVHDELIRMYLTQQEGWYRCTFTGSVGFAAELLRR